MRQGSILTLLSVGTVASVAGLVLTPAGWVMGAKGLTTVGGYLGNTSFVLSSSGYALAGKSKEGLIYDAAIFGITKGAGHHISTARNIGPYTQTYYHTMFNGSIWLMNKGVDKK
jgi:hypothetical protein